MVAYCSSTFKFSCASATVVFHTSSPSYCTRDSDYAALHCPLECTSRPELNVLIKYNVKRYLLVIRGARSRGWRRWLRSCSCFSRERVHAYRRLVEAPIKLLSLCLLYFCPVSQLSSYHILNAKASFVNAVGRAFLEVCHNFPLNWIAIATHPVCSIALFEAVADWITAKPGTFRVPIFPEDGY